jgi:hypothetical protein
MDQLWIEPVGNIIIARIRGVPNEDLLKECQERILSLVHDTQRGRILHDCLEMEAPAVEVPVSQWRLDKDIGNVRLRRAVVVPNTKLAYLARLAFGETDCKVFYNDMTAALNWLSMDNRTNDLGPQVQP